MPRVQARVILVLSPLGGKPLGACGVITPIGLLEPDAGWVSDAYLAEHTPMRGFLTRAPEICIEVSSTSNCRKEFEKRIAAYLAARTKGVWLVHPQIRQVEVWDASGKRKRSAYGVDLSRLFE